ncbi:MAG TPA: imidazole glycerol phosphate synthase subunit HisH [Candidatus Acidoferrum sp.]|nr:imidazole glycerol phosphate synthase subunit HisH [Candidatus Acidoferrum sp.]
MKIALLDYGAGNVTSVERALRRLGAEPVRANTAELLRGSQALILPGVGHYSTLIRALDERQLRAPLVDALHRGVPFLGICLGLQALYEFSEEAPELQGLNFFRGSVSRLPSDVKLPHMGWNQLSLARPSRLLANISREAFFYFAHSFAVLDSNGGCVASCRHGADFSAVIEQRNIFAVQFHPEKSGAPGAQLLKNFLDVASDSNP